MANRIALVAIALMMVTSAVSVVATADTQGGHQSMGLGNFSFNDNATTSTILNLTYKNDNVNAVVSSSIVTKGTASNLAALSNSDFSKKTLNNVTVFTTGNENVLLFATTGSSLLSNPTMAFNLNGNVTQMKLTAAQKLYIEQHTNNKLINYASNQMYKVTVNNTTFYLFSNTDSTLSGNNITYHSSSFATGSNLIVGVTSANWLKNTIEHEVSNDNRAFSYNNTTGMLSGSYISLQFNSSTGLINNYTDMLANVSVFSQISAEGNGSIGNGNPGPVFPTSQPIVAGSVFYFANNTAVYQVHDNPVALSNFYLSNGTMNFSVASNLNISTYNPPGEDGSHSNLSSNITNYSNVDLGDQYDVQSSSIVFLHNSTFSGSLFVRGANVTVNGSNVIVSTSGIAHITFAAPPGLQHIRKNVENDIQYAINHGRLAALVVLGSHGLGNSNVSMNYNGSVQVAVQNVSTNKVFVQVSSKTHEGNNIAIFVPNNVISNSSKITMKFDNQTITLSSNMGNVINATSTTNASFYYMSVKGGTLVIIHVPHFSTHTIEIVNASAVSTTPTLPKGDALYIGLGIVGIIAIVAGVSLSRRRKH